MGLFLLLPSAEGGGPAETLAAGDTTTAFAIWWAGVEVDRQSEGRERLNAIYGGLDATTLYSRFLQYRS